jgi:enoyl-CoA hydratase
VSDAFQVRSERLSLSAGGVAHRLTLNRPEELNPLDWDTVRAFARALDTLEADPDARVGFVTGAGRAFSAGGDLKKYVELYDDPVGFPAFLDELHHAFGRLRRLSVPFVGLVNGVTAAGGLELLLSCDFAIAARGARIGDGHLNFGQMGGGGVLTLLSRIVGLPRASELIFSGRLLSAEEALEWGLVNRIVDDEVLEAEGMAFAEEVASKSPLAVANAKRVMTRSWLESTSVEVGLRDERDTDIEYCQNSHDAREGLQAFAEKREPRFRGK